MSEIIAVTKISRQLLAPYFDNFSLQQLNTIPTGYTNNLIWHLGHIIVTEQILVRKLSGLPLVVSDEMVSKYRKATKPEGDVSQAEVDEIKSLLFSVLDQTELDYNAGNFITYTEYPTSSGYVLKNVNDALRYNLFHEGIHLGIMSAMKKLI